MNHRSIPIKRVNPAPYNPRADLQPGDPAYEHLRRSIDEFGLVQPLVWNKQTGNLVGGHQRFKILVEQGAKTVDVVIVDLPPEREKLLNLALNKVQGDWDDCKLAELLDELVRIPDLDITLSGFKLPETSELIADALHGDDDHEENFDLEAELNRRGPIITKPGELIQLGNHRLICGDATNPEHVRKLMDGKRSVLFATDPPYLVNYDGNNHLGKIKRKQKSETFDWDDAAANPDLFDQFIGTAIAEAITEKAAWYCWHASRRQAFLESIWEKHGAFVHQQIIWAKDRPILSRSHYGWQHEPCFFGWRRPHKPPHTCDEHLSTIWSFPTVAPGQKTDHPTSKPVDLFVIPMQQHTKRGDLCYEPFCGSGSQLIAAQKLGRKCYALEISRRYCDVIVRRWIAYVGHARAPEALVRRYRVKEAA